MRRLPIRLRVTLVFAAAMALLLAGLGLFVYLRSESSLDRTIDAGLRSRARDITGQLATPRGALSREISRVLVQQTESFAQVLTPAGRPLAGVRRFNGEPLVSGADLLRARRRPTMVEIPVVPGGEDPARLLAQPAEVGGRTVVVVTGRTLDDRDDYLASLRRLLVIGGLVALALASLAGYAAIAAALRPVESMRRRAAAISASDPGGRLDPPRGNDELARLGTTLNGMLERLQGAIERERRFVDDASHELRTPLALHRTELELALRYGRDPEELRAAIASAAEEADRLIRLSEDLLVLARADGEGLPLEPAMVHLHNLLSDLGERFAGRAGEEGRDLTVSAADGLSVRADPRQLDRAITNLVDNALRHGAGAVALSAKAAGSRVEIHVTDAGPGFGDDLLEGAFDRFTRGHRGRTGGGSGLGLAIVERIARAHGGAAGASNLPGGGADVWLELPGGGTA